MPTPAEMKAIKDASDEMQKTFKEFRDDNDTRLKKLEDGKGTSELEAKLDKQNEAMNKTDKAIDEMKTALNRVNEMNGGKDVDKKEIEAKCKEISNKYYRGEEMSQDEMKTLKESYPAEYKKLSVQSDPEGGYLVRPEVSAEIGKKIFESSPLRELASAQSISTDSWEEPFDDSDVGANWVGETGARAETSSASLNMIKIDVHEMFANPKATQKVLDDASIDLESWHANKVIERFARLEATSFVAGDGIGKPKGITAYPSGNAFGSLEQVNSGSSGAFTADGLISIQNSLLEVFQMNATWLMQRASTGAVRKLKDSQNRYLWAVGGDLLGGPQNLLLGQPVKFAADMPAIGASALAAAYGDFKAGYKIIDRIGIRVLRDPFTAKPFVLFYTTKRVGAGVVQYQAIKLHKLA